MTTQNIFDLVDTWALSGGPYTSIKMNATDNDTASASLLMDLQVATASKFKVAKDGTLSLSNGSVIITPNYAGATNFQYLNNGLKFLNVGGLMFHGFADSLFGMSQSGSSIAASISTLDVIMRAGGAGKLILGNANSATPVAQTLSVQSITGTNASAATYPFTITGAQGTGNAAGGSIIFQVAPAGGAGAAQNTLVDALTIDSTGKVAVVGLGSSANPSLQIGASSTTGFMSNGSGFISFTGTNGIYATFSNGGGLRVAANVPLEWSNTSGNSYATGDLQLWRDDSNKLALRNGAAAQRFNVYNTWTTSTNYEAFKIDWITTANTVLVGTEKGSGGGTARALEFQTDGVTRLSIATNGSIGSIGYLAVQPSGFTNASILDNSGNIQTVSGGAITFSSSATNAGASIDTTIKRGGAAGVILLGNSTTPTDFSRLQFGGTSASFPAIKRSSTTLQARLADDSAFAPVQGKLTTDTAYTAGAIVVTGYLTLYDSTGTAYRVPCVV